MLQPFEVQWRARDGRLHRLTVPAGQNIDGSSEWVVLALGVFPGWLLWGLGIGQVGTHLAAAVPHDTLYAPLGQHPVEILTDSGEWVPRDKPLTRAECDWAFLDILWAVHVAHRSGWRRHLEAAKAAARWLGVRVGAWPVWWWRRLKRRLGRTPGEGSAD